MRLIKILLLATLPLCCSQPSKQYPPKDNKIRCSFCRADISDERFYIVAHPKGRRSAIFLCEECETARNAIELRKKHV